MRKVDPTAATFRAMRDLVLSADDESLRAGLVDAGVDPAELAKAGRAAAKHALDRAAQESTPNELRELHQGLSVFLQLLRRREALSCEQVAKRASIGADELRLIETEPTYSPRPRTVYQLEQFFRLPKRSLVKMAGMSRDRTPRFTEEVLRFAATSKAMHKLTRDETQILNAFVRFLTDDAAEDE